MHGCFDRNWVVTALAIKIVAVEYNVHVCTTYTYSACVYTSLMLSGNEARSDADVCVCHVSLSRYMESGSLWHYTHAPTCSQIHCQLFLHVGKNIIASFFSNFCLYVGKKLAVFFPTCKKRKLAVETENEANLL